MKVRFSAVAREELVEIGDYTAADDRNAARLYVTALTARCEALKQFPNRYPACPEIVEGLRRATFRSHDIYYSVGPKDVLIERIVHVSRDVSRIFSPGI